MRRSLRFLPHTFRLGTFVFAAATVASIASVRSARAHMNDGMQQLARQLMPYAEQGVMESPRRVELNGESLYLSMGTTHNSVESVLDYYEARCQRNAGHITEQLVAAAQRTPGARALDQATFNQLWVTQGRRSANLETYRQQDEHGGYVACMDVGNARLDGPEILRRVRAAIDSGDLSRFGNMRYAYVTRGSTGTRILTVATEGRFNLFSMFPAQGDAPGSDIPTLARFPGMRRVLSAHEAGHDYALGLHTVQAPQAQVRDFYRREMVQRGWTLMDLPRDRALAPEIEAHRNNMAAFSRGDTSMLLVFEQHEGTTSMMSLAGM